MRWETSGPESDVTREKVKKSENMNNEGHGLYKWLKESSLESPSGRKLSKKVLSP